MNPMYVDVTQSSSEVLRLRRAMASGELKRATDDAARVTLQLEDGTPYPQEGVLQFSDVTVDASHRRDHAARPVPESRRRAVAEHVRARRHRGRGARKRPAGAAAGRDARQQGAGDRDGGRGRATPSRPRTLMTVRTIGTDWLVDSGAEARRSRDRRRPAAGPAGHNRAAARRRPAERRGAGRRRGGRRRLPGPARRGADPARNDPTGPIACRNSSSIGPSSRGSLRS